MVEFLPIGIFKNTAESETTICLTQFMYSITEDHVLRSFTTQELSLSRFLLIMYTLSVP